MTGTVSPVGAAHARPTAPARWGGPTRSAAVDRHLAHTALALVAAIAVLLPGCGGDAGGPLARAAADRPVLVVGDSVMAHWRDQGADVGSVLADELGRPVTNRAVSGATVLGPDGIPSQIVDGDHGWVVMDGGANDLGRACGTGRGEQLLDEVLGEDGTEGVLATTVAGLLAEGHPVVVSGYHRVPGVSLLGPCADQAASYEQRLARLAATDADIVYVDQRDTLDPGDPTHLADDGLHPSPTGARLLAHRIAAAIRAAEG